ncbi:choline transport protein [Polychaeton citri CBS 116435]|uniref:Choline transport protein n=1 Tax=Polychaeton citri CBS 116435 TaxID=1314669 RepID=A0A9P4QDW6_9PEZI|nr:choline transport protein [Polychaeton citri CBS 116435]
MKNQRKSSLIPSLAIPIENRASFTDDDALRLAELGYDQAMSRKFSVWSILGIGFSLTNSWFGLSAAMVTGINSGGTALIIYGVIIVAVMSTCVAISLSELASALPSAGGQYYWAYKLAPNKYRDFASYFVGWFSWAGSIFTSASVAFSLAFAVCGCYQLSHPDYEVSKYHVFAAYQLINAFAAIFNCFGKLLPATATFTLYVSLVSFAVILITVPSVAPTHQSARFVFGTFINNTGWDQAGIAFIVGLINTNWPFACLDSATHLAEEVPKPERNIPIAICGTVAIGFTTAWFFAVAMFFSLVGDFDTLVDSPTGVPILALFNSALTGRSAQVVGAIFLESLLICTGLGCQIASHTWQSRLVWSFSRDGGIPFSKWLAVCNQTLDVPLRAHLTSCVLVAIVGVLYLGSDTAFNSMVTATIVLLYISYAVPVTCLLFVKGRDNIKHGPFWMGKIGAVSNVVLLAWTLFTLVMYSFPYTQPVTAGNMNYVSAVYGVVTLIVLTDWFLRGRKHYGQTDRDEQRDSVVSQILERRESALSIDDSKIGSSSYAVEA